MRESFKKSVTLSLAALTLAIGVAATATPASAHRGPGFPRWGHHGWGPGLAIGLIGAAGVAAAADAASSCVGYHNIYDQYGNYLGRQAVNVC